MCHLLFTACIHILLFPSATGMPHLTERSLNMKFLCVNDDQSDECIQYIFNENSVLLQKSCTNISFCDVLLCLSTRDLLVTH